MSGDHDSMSAGTFDEPLLIVLDEDDDEDLSHSEDFVLTSARDVLLDPDEISTTEYSTDQSAIAGDNLTDVNTKSNCSHQHSKPNATLAVSNRVSPAAEVGKNPTQKQPRSRPRTKSTPTNSSSSALGGQSLDTILSYVSFDNKPRILTVSRMGSIYYCVEDLYLEVFATLCRLEQFIDLLVKPDIVSLKIATLSEKMSIEQINPKLKHFSRTRYRLVSINSTDHLYKLKKVLSMSEHKNSIETAMEEMQRYKRTLTSLQSSSTVSSALCTKRGSAEDQNDKCKYARNNASEPSCHEVTRVKSPIRCTANTDAGSLSTNQTTLPSIEPPFSLETVSNYRLMVDESVNAENQLDRTSHACKLTDGLTFSTFSSSAKSFAAVETLSTSFVENILFKEHPSELLYIDTIDDLSTTNEHDFTVAYTSPTAPPLNGFTPVPTQIRNHSSSSPRMSPVEVRITHSAMSDYRSTTTVVNSMKSIHDYYPMPTIVHVEEDADLRSAKDFNRTASWARKTSALDFTVSNISRPLSSVDKQLQSSPHSSTLRRPRRSPYDFSDGEESSLSLSYDDLSDLPSAQPSLQSKSLSTASHLSGPFVVPRAQKLKHPSLSTIRRSLPHSLLFCSDQRTPQAFSAAERSSPPSLNLLNSSPNATMTRRQDESAPYSKLKSFKVTVPRNHRLGLTPYLRTKTYFAPLSQSHPQSHNVGAHLQRPSPIHSSSALMSPPNTPSEITSRKICKGNLALNEAVAKHGHCDMDTLPKLLVRHKKTYQHQAVQTMGQLLPTWFAEPDYCCIHCFTCNRVFAPQQFMTHIDAKEFLNKQPLNISSIQLLPSEKLSAHKVELWNQFCSNLATFTRTGRISGFESEGTFLDDHGAEHDSPRSTVTDCYFSRSSGS